MVKAAAAIYARVSSKTPKNGSGIARQTKVCQQKCTADKTKVAYKICEVISGSLPLKKRPVFNDLMEQCGKQQIKKLIVEGSRALARNASVAESIYEKSKELDIQIVPVDLPDLCDHNPNPAQKFLRRVMFAYTELEKDMTVNRLQHGWNMKLNAERQKKRQGKRVRLNQDGMVKINGRQSILEKTNLSGKQRAKLIKANKKYLHQELSSRELAAIFSQILGKKKAWSSK